MRGANPPSVQLLAQFLSCQPQAAFAGRQRDFHDLGHFGQTQPFMVMQGKRQPLILRNFIKYLVNDRAQLVCIQSRLRPHKVSGQPGQGVSIVSLAAADRPDQRIMRTSADVVDQQIAGDSKHPGPKTPQRQVVPGLAEHLEQCFLRQVLGQLTVAGISDEKPQQRPLLPLDQLGKGRIISVLDADHELVVVVHRTVQSGRLTLFCTGKYIRSLVRVASALGRSATFGHNAVSLVDEVGRRTSDGQQTLEMAYGMAEWELKYGHGATFECRVSDVRLVGVHNSPPALPDARAAIAAALAHPLDFPAFEQCVFPGDRVVLVLDRDTPCAEEMLAEVWRILERRDVSAETVTILQPGAFQGQTPEDPRRLLSSGNGHQPAWRVHNPADQDSCRYLASTAAGERVYLSRDLLDADLVMTIGSLGFDSLLGYRGTHSAVYPGLSDAEAIRKAHGQGHDELTPDDARPLRQLVDEVAWLLGAQFTMQVVPAGGDGIAAVIAGQAESVLQRGKQLLADHWRMRLARRPELVIAAVEADAAGHDWSQVAAALELARGIVVRDGRVLLLTDLAVPPSDGIRLISESRSPRDALRPLREMAPPDLLAATRIAKGIDWTNVYLLSRLDPQLVEDLCMIPLDSPAEAARLIEGDEPCAVISGAQHASAQIVA